MTHIVNVNSFGQVVIHISVIDYALNVTEATELRDLLNVAIPEAKKLEDPFERWWRKVRLSERKSNEAVINGYSICKDVARIIWEAERTEEK